MNNSLRSFIVAAFLCVGVFSCKAMEFGPDEQTQKVLNNGLDKYLGNKEVPKQIATILMGTAFSLLGKGTVQVFCKVIPALRPWIDDIEFSLLLSGKGKELTLSNNIYTSLMGLYFASKSKHKEYKAEFLVGLFIVAPLLTTTYQYITRPHQDSNKNSQN